MIRGGAALLGIAAVACGIALATIATREGGTFAATPSTVVAVPRAIVTAVFPSSERVPANLLKFYIHFSRPMMRGEVGKRVALLDERGQPLGNVFLHADENEELWDPSGRRLTLFLDPGRIKRGLMPNRQLGAPLEAGRRYTLRIDPGWPDAEGVPLKSGFSRAYVAVAADRTSPRLSEWLLNVPRAGSTDPVRLGFPESLDSALSLDSIVVVNGSGARVPAVPSLAHGERELAIVPARRWQAGRYEIRVKTRLEDLAGNNLNRPFDVEISSGNPSLRPERSEEVLRFQIG